MLLPALIWLLAHWVIPNVIVFGAAFLVARWIVPEDSGRRTVVTLLIAGLIAFGPRLPGLVSDAAYEIGSERVRSVERKLILPAGTRVGLDIDLPQARVYSSGPEEASVPFRQRYYPAVQWSERKLLTPEGFRHEVPRRNLLWKELLLNEGQPESEEVQIVLRGRDTGAHFEFAVEVRSQGELIAEYRDRHRLRWPGPANGEDFPLFAYLAQSSLLDVIADSALPGQLVNYSGGSDGPVTKFLNEVIEVTPVSHPEPPTASISVQRIPPHRSRFGEQTSFVGCPEEIRKSDSDLLSFSRDGISRRRSRDIAVGAKKYQYQRAAVCTDHGVATLNRGDPGQYLIALYDHMLDLQCTMRFTLPDGTVPIGYKLGGPVFRPSTLGFDIDWKLHLKDGPDKNPQSAFRVKVVAPEACVELLGRGPRFIARDIEALHEQMAGITREILDTMNPAWHPRFFANQQVWESGMRSSCASDDVCLVFAHETRIESLRAYLRVASGDFAAFQALDEMQHEEWKGLLPIMLRVDFDPENPPDGLVLRKERVEVELVAPSAPVILALTGQHANTWTISKAPDVWLVQLMLNGHVRTEPKGRIETVGFHLPPRPKARQFYPVYPPENTATVRGLTPARLQRGTQLLLTARSDRTIAEQKTGLPDKYDAMVEAALRKAPPPAVATAYRDLRPDLKKLPDRLATRIIFAMWHQDDITVRVRARETPVFLVLRARQGVNWTIRPDRGARVAGVFLDDEAGPALVDAPQGVPVYARSVSGNMNFRETISRIFTDPSKRLDLQAISEMSGTEVVVE